MIRTIFDGKKGVFMSEEEFESIRNKISENNKLIAELCEEVGLNVKTI